MALNILIIAAIVLTGLLLVSPQVAGSKTWRAVVTPLASIIGSGFLVLGPILDSAYGQYAPLAMAALCIGAFLFGSAIRYNIATLASHGRWEGRSEKAVETASSWALAFAYVISVSYYLNLFGSFGVSLTPFNQPFFAKLVTTAIFVLILLVGWTSGFKALEKMEYASVATKLVIIAGLLFGLAVYFGGKATSDSLVYNAPGYSGWSMLTLGFGLIVTVQGFETSRYLGAAYDAPTRIRSMRVAQYLSAFIYMTYIVLIAYIFEKGDLVLSETAIIDMLYVVTPILPPLLVIAALAAQFSAAVADTSGSGGLFAEVTGNRMRPRQAYALLVAAGIIMTWTLNVFEIISYASRAFALYYALQSALAALAARRLGSNPFATPLFVLLAIFGIAIVVFGQSIE